MKVYVLFLVLAFVVSIMGWLFWQAMHAESVTRSQAATLAELAEGRKREPEVKPAQPVAAPDPVMARARASVNSALMPRGR